MGVRAVLDQEDALAAAERGDALDVERDVPADVDEERRARPVAARLGLEVRERGAEVVAVAVDEHHLGARRLRRERRRHERVRGAQHLLAADAGELERRQRGSRPARRRDRRQPVPGLPRRFEGLDQRPLRPAIRREDLVPQRVQASAIALIEPDCERAEALRYGMPGHPRERIGAVGLSVVYDPQRVGHLSLTTGRTIGRPR